MIFQKIFKTALLVGLLSPVMAQQTDITTATFSADQVEAIRQIEKEYEALEKKRAATTPDNDQEKQALAEERDLRIKNMLSAEQWSVYQKNKARLLEKKTAKKDPEFIID